MRYTLQFLVVVMLIPQCKAKENVATNINGHGIIASEMIFSSQKDSICCYRNDTVLISLPVEFNKGRFWSQRDTVKQISSLKQDETQQFNGQELKDFQRFYYTFKDTGSFALTYFLRSPIGKDTTVYATQYKYFNIKQ